MSHLARNWHHSSIIAYRKLPVRSLDDAEDEVQTGNTKDTMQRPSKTRSDGEKVRKGKGGLKYAGKRFAEILGYFTFYRTRITSVCDGVATSRSFIICFDDFVITRLR